MAESSAIWQKGMAFNLTLQGATIPVDAVEQFGGSGYGPQPKGLMLSALSGCTGMDVVSILGKKKVAFESFSVNVTGEVSDAHPKVFTSVHLVYAFKGNDIDPAKVVKTIELSLNGYCAVAATLKHTAKLTYNLEINGETVASGEQE